MARVRHRMTPGRSISTAIACLNSSVSHETLPPGRQMPDLRKLHVLFFGRVQGVGFRYTVQEFCAANRVTGWVRNREDGSVEAELVGESDQVQRALDAIKDSRAANLRSVRIESESNIAA